jgi:hypothetical protein
MPNALKPQKNEDALKDDKVPIADIITIFRDVDSFTLSCRDAMDNSTPVDLCQQKAFNEKCKRTCSLAPYELRRQLLIANRGTTNVQDATNSNAAQKSLRSKQKADTATDTPAPTSNLKSMIMKQYVAVRDYELDFSHRSMLKATVTQLGITSEQCETACLTDDACAIATYYEDSQRCVYKTTFDTGDTVNTNARVVSDVVYPDVAPNVVSFEKATGKLASEASRRASERSRLVKEATDQESRRIFDRKWLHKPNTSINNVLYSWATEIRSETAPTDVQIMACAARCTETVECSSFVIRHDTTNPQNGDAVCGLVMQPYTSDSIVSTTNISTYELRK